MPTTNTTALEARKTREDRAIDNATRHIYFNGRPVSEAYRVGIVRAGMEAIAALESSAPSAAEPVKTLHIMDEDEQKVMARSLMRSVQVIAPSAASEREALTDERWDFEVMAKQYGFPLAGDEDTYFDEFTAGAWFGWQQRAALHSTGKPDGEVAK